MDVDFILCMATMSLENFIFELNEPKIVLRYVHV